jgi:predicted nucleic acid-binding protein
VSIVLDTSATLAFILEDERSLASMTLFKSISRLGASVPNLWPYEVANSLTYAMRRGRISMDTRSAALMNLTKLAITIDTCDLDGIWLATVALADLYQLTIYDAAYLELAQRKRVPLATLDDALTRACKASGVTLIL